MLIIEVSKYIFKNNYPKIAYEYNDAIELNGISAKYFRIPESIILNKCMDNKRASVFSYMCIRKGLDDMIEFSLSSLIKWCGNKYNSRSGKLNEKYMNIIDTLVSIGYIKKSDVIYNLSTVDSNMVFNSDMLFEDCSKNSFAVIYVDELYSIMNYKKKNNNDTSLNNTTILLVFAYLRNAIYRRSNKLKIDDINVDNKNDIVYDISNRRMRCPEVLAESYNNISDNIGISSKTISRCVDILVNELGLIVTYEAYRTKKENGEFRTQYTLFANAYKRESKYVLDYGEKYYLKEIERKVNVINKYKNFIIKNKENK